MFILWVPILALVLSIAIHRPAAAEDPPLFDSKWGLPGTADGRFDRPISLVVDQAGDVFVSDYRNRRIQKFSPDGVFQLKWGRGGTLPGDFRAPVGLAVGDGGNIYHAAAYNSLLQVFTNSGVFIRAWGSYGSAPGQFWINRGVAVDREGHVYVVEESNHRVQKFTADGTFLKSWGSVGTGPDQFWQPMDIAVDSKGNVYVTDPPNQRVAKFTAEGEFVMTLGNLRWPVGICVDKSDFVYVTDLHSTTINKYSPDGALIYRFGRPGVWAPAEFSEPSDVAVDADGMIYVADTGNNRIQKFKPCPGRCPPAEPCPRAGSPKLLLHVTSPSGGDACLLGKVDDCRKVSVEGDLSRADDGPYYNVYLLIAGETQDNIAGMQCGIDYDRGKSGAMADKQAIDVLSWTNCGTLEFPSTGEIPWPHPGSGNIVTWRRDECQTGLTAVAGYFYVAAYSPDILRITARPVDGQAKVADCFGAEIRLSPKDLGFVAFSAGKAEKGCNPFIDGSCDRIVPVTPTSWSSIKAAFGRD